MRFRKWLILPGLAGLLAALGVTAAGAQGGDSSISGLVVYRGGEPANARIYVGREGKYRQVTSKFRAGQNVGFRLEQLLPGRYELLVTAPNAQPRRIWGIKLMTFEQRKVDVALDRATTPEQEVFYLEHNFPRLDDLPRDWEEGWLRGTVLSARGALVEGVVKLYRGSSVYREIAVGTPTLPAYFEDRGVTPGNYDLEFHPSPTSRLKRLRIERFNIAQRARTTLGTLRVPEGNPGDLQIITAPERVLLPIR
jgi:hypothetical protein